MNEPRSTDDASETPVATVPEWDDRRDSGPMTGTPRQLLDHWVDTYRESVLLKVSGLDGEQLCLRSVPPSTLSLAGLVRHLTEVERYWVREVMQGHEHLSYPYSNVASPNGDLDDPDPVTAVAEVEAYRHELEGTRQILVGYRELDTLAVGKRHGRAVNLGWILTHLIEEYARHLGHMDLLRECVDGRTGY